MNKPVPVNPPELRSTLVAASSMPWQRTEFDGIEMKILYQDTEGRSTILFRMAPGAVVPLHEHTALEQTFMLEGSLQDSEGSVGAGDFVWRPGGNIHVARAPNGATFISIFNRPNRFFGRLPGWCHPRSGSQAGPGCLPAKGPALCDCDGRRSLGGEQVKVCIQSGQLGWSDVGSAKTHDQ
jgi:quercetin dioxygenase-like cupin family protein